MTSLLIPVQIVIYGAVAVLLLQVAFFIADSFADWRERVNLRAKAKALRELHE